MWKMLGGLLLLLIEPIVSRVAAAFGMGLVSYTGFSFLMRQLEE